MSKHLKIKIKFDHEETYLFKKSRCVNFHIHFGLFNTDAIIIILMLAIYISYTDDYADAFLKSKFYSCIYIYIYMSRFNIPNYIINKAGTFFWQSAHRDILVLLVISLVHPVPLANNVVEIVL